MPALLSRFLALTMLLASALAGVSLGGCPALAAEDGQTGRVFVPAPPKGKGDKCVADTDFMRRNHMTLLEHQRDRTVQEGIRTDRFSLKKCLTCHAVNADAQAVSSYLRLPRARATNALPIRTLCAATI